MCGITGFLYFDRNRVTEKDRLRRMTRILSHRGPDGSGLHASRNIALGHARHATQPVNRGASGPNRWFRTTDLMPSAPTRKSAECSRPSRVLAVAEDAKGA